MVFQNKIPHPSLMTHKRWGKEVFEQTIKLVKIMNLKRWEEVQLEPITEMKIHLKTKVPRNLNLKEWEVKQYKLQLHKKWEEVIFNITIKLVVLKNTINQCIMNNSDKEVKQCIPNQKIDSQIKNHNWILMYLKEGEGQHYRAVIRRDCLSKIFYLNTANPKEWEEEQWKLIIMKVSLSKMLYQIREVEL